MGWMGGGVLQLHPVEKAELLDAQKSSSCQCRLVTLQKHSCLPDLFLVLPWSA